MLVRQMKGPLQNSVIWQLRRHYLNYRESRPSVSLGADSGTAHIATAVGMPTMTNHGPSDWRGWARIMEL